MDIRDLTTCSGGFSCQTFFRILPNIFIFPPFMPFPCRIIIWNITHIPAMRSCTLLPVPAGFSAIFPHLRKKPGFSGTSSEKRSRIFPVLEFYCLLPGILLRHGFPEFRIQPERPSHLFTAQFRSDKGGRISLLSSVWPYAHRTCFLRPLQPEHPGKCLSEKSAPVY